MNKIITLLLFILLINISLSAQRIAIKGIDNNLHFNKSIVDQQLKSYTIFQVNMSNIQALQNGRNDQIEELQFQLNVGRFHTTVYLTNSGIIAPDYKRVTTSGEKITSPIPSPMEGYTSEGLPVRLTVNKDYMHGFIQTKETRFYIEPLNTFDRKADKELYVLFNMKNAINNQRATCGTEMPENYESPAQVDSDSIDGTCYRAEYALAADYMMYKDYGSVAGVENQIISITNAMQTNYDNEFSASLKYIVVAMFIVDCKGCDPWTENKDAGALLSDFSQWGNRGGFGQDYDVASLWTDRNFKGGTVGIAWVGSLCYYFRYNCLQDYTGNSDALRVVNSHELGHNWGCLHDKKGSPYIMAPRVNITNDWSIKSDTTIENSIAFRSRPGGCIDSCETTIQALFTADIWKICEGSSTQFYENAYNGEPDSMKWLFSGGNPSISRDTSPSVIYSDPGNYDVTLIVYDSIFTDTLMIVDYVEVFTEPSVDFRYTVDGNYVHYFNFSRNVNRVLWEFGDGETSDRTNNLTHIYSDSIVNGRQVTLTIFNPCDTVSRTITIDLDTPPIADFIVESRKICVGTRITFRDSSQGSITARRWIFEGGETFSLESINPTVLYNYPGVYDVTLIAGNPSGIDTIFKKDFINVIDVPLAQFQYEISGDTVQFIQLSQYAEDYEWSFGGGVVLDSINLLVLYEKEGSYTIKLIVENLCGVDSLIKTVEIKTTAIENTPQPAFKVYPNPFRNFVNIYFDSRVHGRVIIRLINMTGEMIKQKELYVRAEETTRINTDELGPGMYFLEIRQEGKRTFRKLINSD